MEHFNQGNAYSLCTDYAGTEAAIQKLTGDDLNVVRHLPSFRTHVETMTDCRQVIAILTDDAFLMASLPHLIRSVHMYFRMFYGMLRLLLALVQDLPKNGLGKNVSKSKFNF